MDKHLIGVKKMLTKEECLEALDRIVQEFGCDPAYYGLNMEYTTLLALIDEHFDNPPLKFEELKEGMWVWCYGSYSQIRELSNFGKIKLVYFDCDSVRFEENRFYRKQVM